MKVFLIFSGDFDEYDVDAVALMRNKAEEFVADDLDPDTGYSIRGRYAPAYEIREMEVLS